MKRKSLFVMLVFALALVLGFSSCKKDADPGIVGTWYATDTDISFPNTLTFTKNGTVGGYVDGYLQGSVPYTVNGDTVIFTMEGYQITGVFTATSLTLRVNVDGEVIVMIFNKR